MFQLKGIQKQDFDGIMRGLVIDNADPKREGRVAVMIPKLMTGWVDFQPPQKPGTKATLNKFIIKNYEENNYIDKIQQVNFFWARNCEMIDSAPAGYYINNEKTPKNSNDTNTHQEVKVNIDTHYNRYGGSMRIPRLGTYVFIIFDDGDPQKCYYLPFGPSQSGETIPLKSLEEESTSNAKSPVKRANINVIREWHNGNIFYVDTNHNINTIVIKYEDGAKWKMRYCENAKFNQWVTQDGHSIFMKDKDKKSPEQYVEIKTTENNTTRWDDYNDYIQTMTTGGHWTRYDDKNKFIQTTTTSGHYMRYDDKNKFMQIQTANGHIIRMDDEGKFIQVQTTYGEIIRLDGETDTITLFTAGGSILRMIKGENIELYTKKEISLVSGGDICLIAAKNIDINAGDIFTLNAKSFTIGCGGSIKGDVFMTEDAMISGISFINHFHMGNLCYPTTIPV